MRTGDFFPDVKCARPASGGGADGGSAHYNGRSEAAEEEVLRLSDSFPEGAHADIEVRVRMVNVNPGMGERMKEACEPLREYTWLVEEIRRNAEGMGALPRD